MGITEKKIEKLKSSISIGSAFNYRGIVGIVCEKHKYFVVIERLGGYKECFCWTELLCTD